jgi:hypothetical protein
MPVLAAAEKMLNLGNNDEVGSLCDGFRSDQKSP